MKNFFGIFSPDWARTLNLRIMRQVSSFRSAVARTVEQHVFKNVSKCLNTNIYSYLETSGGQSSNLYFNVVHFLTPVLVRHLWQSKTVVFLHWCLIHAALFICELHRLAAVAHW